jgi:hypothetical protein
MIGNMLHWKTSKEKNVQHYVVQKSVDGINYFDVGEKIMPSTASKIKSYNFLDIKASMKVYYRLKIVELKKEVFTETILATRKVANEITFTNLLTPEVKDFLKLEYGSLFEKPVQYQLIDANGKLISYDILVTQKGFNTFILSLKDKPKGTYKLKFINGQEIDEVLIVKTTDAVINNGRL